MYQWHLADLILIFALPAAIALPFGRWLRKRLPDKQTQIALVASFLVVGVILALYGINKLNSPLIPVGGDNFGFAASALGTLILVVGLLTLVLSDEREAPDTKI